MNYKIHYIHILILFFVGLKYNSFSQHTNGKEFITCLQQENFLCAYEKFDNNISKLISEEKLKKIWNAIITSKGKLNSFYFNCSEFNKEQKVRIDYFSCLFEKSKIDMKIIFNSNNEVAGFFLVNSNNCNSQKSKYKFPKYIDTESFDEKDVKIKSDTIILNASVCIPKSNKINSICILIHGSGPNDRDLSIANNKPYKDLAYGLASNGIASIRFDKRTYTYKNLNSNITIKEEVTDDIKSIIEYINKNNQLKKLNICIVGHSLGGMLAPKIVEQNKEIKACVLIAANARKLEDLIVLQMKYLAKLDGEIDKYELKQIENMMQKTRYLKDSLSMDSPNIKLPLNIPANYWLSLNQYNPIKTIQKLHIPILILQGKRDYQVTIKDFLLWKRNTEDKKNIDFKLYKKLNHLFFEGKGKSTPNEYMKQSNIPKYVIKDLVKWIEDAFQ